MSNNQIFLLEISLFALGLVHTYNFGTRVFKTLLSKYDHYMNQEKYDAIVQKFRDAGRAAEAEYFAHISKTEEPVQALIHD